MADDQPTQTYYAKSAFSDPTNIVFFFIGLLQIQDVVDLLIEWGMRPKLIVALVAALGLFVRTFNAQRPVAFIAPTQVKPVEVKKLQPTEQGSETPPSGGAGQNTTEKPATADTEPPRLTASGRNVLGRLT